MSPEDAFIKLREFLDRFDAMELLCQASMTFLFAPEGQFHSESDDVQIWGRHIEFAAGYYAVQEDRGSSKETVTGWTLESFKDLIDNYYQAVDIAEFTTYQGVQHGPFSLASARIHSMHVRGEAYPHQFAVYAREIYGPHDDWFLEKLGFTISDASAVGDALVQELNNRFAYLRESSKNEAKNLAANDDSWQETGMTRGEAETSAWCQLFYGQAKEHFRFTLEQIIESSAISEDRCRAVLARLSQKPPFHNPFFLDTFAEARKAPWDYNSLAERPLFTDGHDYWLVIPYLFKRTLYYTFYFDLMSDRAYKPTFEARRAAYLEEKTAEYLQKVFPSSSVLLNPAYPSGDEFTDVLVLHDGKILIVQCKAKTLTRPAFIGADADALKSDVQKAVKDAIDQGAKCRRFLESSDTAKLFYKGTELVINMEAVTKVEIITVTYLPLHTMATRIREVETDLALSHCEYSAWAVSLGDLEIVTEICTSPARFLQYVQRRLQLEKGDIRVHGDEMDLLGFFLSQGLWMSDEQFKDVNLVAVSGFSDKVDEYVFRRWDCREKPDRPKVSRPEGFDSMIDSIEALSQLHRTDCAIGLLELSGSASDAFIKMYNLLKEKVSAKQSLQGFSMGGDQDSSGLSFIAVPETADNQFLYQRTQGFGLLEKYSTKAHSWIALGSKEGSSRVVDLAFWLEWQWEHNETFEAATIDMPRGIRMTI